MPDIAMCEGVGCSKRENCYRHTAKESSYQSYFGETPGVQEVGGTSCEYYISNGDRVISSDNGKEL